tara:strand:- start:468 stop:704 length:237 start_codon:yes stop_codon:yes gene_type:complete
MLQPIAMARSQKDKSAPCNTLDHSIGTVMPVLKTWLIDRNAVSSDLKSLLDVFITFLILLTSIYGMFYERPVDELIAV